MPQNVLVIGVGNEYRADDGLGPAVIGFLHGRVPAEVTLSVTDGEPTELIDAWADRDLAVVVDAVVCDPARPGRIHREDTLPRGAAAASTHGLGIPDAVRLAQALGRLPRRMVVYAVEIAESGYGSYLSPAVAAAVADVASAVLGEIGAAAKAGRRCDQREGTTRTDVDVRDRRSLATSGQTWSADDVPPANGLSVLSRDQCRDLLTAADIGRVIVSLSALPAAFPVNYRLVDDSIVFRTAPGTKLTAAVDQAVVGFEVDELDPRTRSGWSVLAVGPSNVVTDPREIAELDEAGITSWLDDDLKHYVKIDIWQVSGRWLNRAE
jgi:hydrogenase maturation protease